MIRQKIFFHHFLERDNKVEIIFVWLSIFASLILFWLLYYTISNCSQPEGGCGGRGWDTKYEFLMKTFILWLVTTKFLVFFGLSFFAGFFYVFGFFLMKKIPFQVTFKTVLKWVGLIYVSYSSLKIFVTRKGTELFQ